MHAHAWHPHYNRCTLCTRTRTRVCSAIKPHLGTPQLPPSTTNYARRRACVQRNMRTPRQARPRSPLVATLEGVPIIIINIIASHCIHRTHTRTAALARRHLWCETYCTPTALSPSGWPPTTVFFVRCLHTFRFFGMRLRPCHCGFRVAWGASQRKRLVVWDEQVKYEDGFFVSTIFDGWV